MKTKRSAFATNFVGKRRAFVSKSRYFAPIGLFRKIRRRGETSTARRLIESRWKRGQNRRNVARLGDGGEQEEALLGNSGGIPDV